MAQRRVALILLLILSFTLIILTNVEVVGASGTVYIRADGSVEGTDRIQRNGDIYTLTDNISEGIQVQRSFIVLDGAGYTLQGTGGTGEIGIDLRNERHHYPSRPEISNVTIKNLRIVNFDRGIENVNTRNNTIIGNYIADCSTGINIGSSNNLIKNNTLANNVNGVSIAYSGGNNIITENNMINDAVSSNNVFTVWLSPQPTIDRNYWSDYNGTDSDGDGIGDTPHTRIAGNETIYIDNHPLMEPVPIIPEFPSWIILPLFLVATLAVLVYKKKTAFASA